MQRLEKKKPNETQILLSSTIASVVSTTLVNPLDVLKVRMQNQCQNSFKQNFNSQFLKQQCKQLGQILTKNYGSLSVQCQSCQRHQTIKQLIKNIWLNEGKNVFMNGVRFAVVWASFSNIMYFFFYENIVRKFSNFTQHKVFLPLSASLCSRTLTTGIAFPLEIIRTIQQSSVGKTNIKDIGKIQFYRGFSITLQRDLIFSMFYWVLVENIRLQYNRLFFKKNQQTSLLQNIIAGSISGGICSIITLPWDVVKTRLQANQKLQFNGNYQLMKNIYQKEGYQALFLGIVPRLIKTVIYCSSMLSIYEQCLNIAQRYNLAESNNYTKQQLFNITE